MYKNNRNPNLYSTIENLILDSSSYSNSRKKACCENPSCAYLYIGEYKAFDELERVELARSFFRDISDGGRFDDEYELYNDIIDRLLFDMSKYYGAAQYDEDKKEIITGLFQSVLNGLDRELIRLATPIIDEIEALRAFEDGGECLEKKIVRLTASKPL